MSDPLDLSALREYIAAVPWHTARMPYYPHQYTRSREQERQGFLWLWRTIKEHGTPYPFGRRMLVYLDVDEYTYWGMCDETDGVDEIINRARLDSPVTQRQRSARRT